MKKTFILVIITALLFSACAQPIAPAEIPINSQIPEASFKQAPTYEANSALFCENLIKKDYATCFNEFSAKTAEAFPVDQLQAVWEEIIASCGEFVGIEKNEISEKNGLTTIVQYCAFEKNGVTISITYDSEGKISGLWFNYYEPQNIAPTISEAIEEVEITVGADPNYPLNAKLTKQKDVQSDYAAVLVHGSGSTDMDETIGSNKPFRDIALGLSEQGIDVLRYDKRTFDHPSSATETNFTVQEETIDDAIAAAKYLKDAGYKKVIYIGHSLGGMLALRADSQTDLFDGLVSLAGSPRQLTDISKDQNQAIIDTFTEQKDIDDANAIIDAEVAKIEGIDAFSEEELAKTTIFGIPATYIKDLQSSDTFDLAKNYKKPILVLQGSEDFQVSPKNDFEAFKEALKGNDKAEFILYDGLNHLFMTSNGLKSVEEYKTPSNVDKKVIEDMAVFIKKV